MQAALTVNKDNAIKLAMAYRSVYEQYVTDASFLWVLRSVSFDQPHYNVADVCNIDKRINACIDGLLTSIDVSWEICLEALEIGQAGEIFVSAMLAFKSGDIDKIKTVVTAGVENPESTDGLISALACLPNEISALWGKKFLASKYIEHKYLAIAVASVRRENPGSVIENFLNNKEYNDDKRLYSRLLRIIGEQKLVDYKWALFNAVEDKDYHVGFWANWSLLLLGETAAIKNMQTFIETKGPLQALAVATTFRLAPISLSKAWISELSADPKQARIVIQAAGILGDPVAVPWLIEKMRKADVGHVAGEAFSLITGINLAEEKLLLEKNVPEIELPQKEDDDKIIELDPDENLPFPDADKVADVWKKINSNFLKNQRYFMGIAIKSNEIEATLLSVLTSGLQRQRQAAALELTVLDPCLIYPNWKAWSKV